MEEIPGKPASDRRRFLQRIAGSAAFASPVVRTFMIAAAEAGIGAGVAEAATTTAPPTTATTNTTGSTTTTAFTTTSATTTTGTTSTTPTTTAAPTTTATTTAFTTTLTTTEPTTTIYLPTTSGPPGNPPGNGNPVPEIDPASVGAALTFLASSVLVIRDRYFAKTESAIAQPDQEEQS